MSKEVTISQRQVEMENGCSNVAMEEEVSFSIVVKVDQCDQGGNNTYDFNIEVNV